MSAKKKVRPRTTTFVVIYTHSDGSQTIEETEVPVEPPVIRGKSPTSMAEIREIYKAAGFDLRPPVIKKIPA